jgi:3-methyl-2-oxobutanoate hydroxymethyltransferase
VQGHTSTVPVSLNEMVYHTRCVARGNQTAWVVSDLPFGAYQESREQALRSCVADAGRRPHGQARRRWLDGEVVHFLTERGIPVCAHLGLTPQSVHALGGYRIQGRDEAGAATCATPRPRAGPGRCGDDWCWN